MGANNYLGQEITQNIFYALDAYDPAAPVAPTTGAKLLGGVNNGGSIGSTKTSIDVTTGYHNDKIAGSDSEDGTVGGFYLTNAGSNHLTLIDHIDSETQPYGWVGKQYKIPGFTRLRWVPVLFLGCPITGTTNEAVTFELTYESIGPGINVDTADA